MRAKGTQVQKRQPTEYAFILAQIRGVLRTSFEIGACQDFGRPWDLPAGSQRSYKKVTHTLLE
jgi:hypothetical protein